MSSKKEQLVIRFVELLVEKAMRNGQTISSWTTMLPAWRRIFSETVPEFLETIGYSVTEGQIDERAEDEHIRLLCDNLSARQRLKVYRQLYALGCRIDAIDRVIAGRSR